MSGDARDLLRFATAADQEPRQALARVIESIAAGNGRFHFALLREAPLDAGLMDSGDADLLGTRDSIVELLRLLLMHAVAGDIHFRVTASKPEKLQVTVYSTDLKHHATYDLWIDLPQLRGGSARLCYGDVAPLLSRERGIELLPDCLAGAVYLQHLLVKRKPLGAPHTVARIELHAGHQCGDKACGVSRWFRDIQRAGQIRPPAPAEADRQVERLLQIRLNDATHRVPHRWRPRRRMETSDAVCILGVDGVGKSTLIESLVRDGLAASDALVGKKLYRRSLLYRLATRGRRRVDPAARESMDERLAPVVFLRAVSAFRRTLAWRRLTGAGTLLVDRCPLDFLYLGRKTDGGQFHPATDRLEPLAPLTPTVQLVAPHSVTSARKPELTPSGHAAYDDALLMRIAGQSPCDHLVFHNGAPVTQSTAELAMYLNDVLQTRGRRRAA